MKTNPIDPHFTVTLISQSHNPQLITYWAMHQCYAEDFISGQHGRFTETEAGEVVVRRLLKGDRGHYGPLEHPQITFNCGWFPHSVMQQIRTHRVGISFDVQSFRYTGRRIVDVADGDLDVESVFYARPVGSYTDRDGKKYEYTQEMRQDDLQFCIAAAHRYKKNLEKGMSEEHARSFVPFDVRQHWVMSCNLRSLMHLLDLRAKADAQLECQQLCQLIWPYFESWVPEIAAWYKENRWGKARLAP